MDAKTRKRWEAYLKTAITPAEGAAGAVELALLAPVMSP